MFGIHKGTTINIKLSLIDKILQKLGYTRDSIIIKEITLEEKFKEGKEFWLDRIKTLRWILEEDLE